MTSAILNISIEPVKRAASKTKDQLIEPAVGTLIHEIRQLTQLTQVQIAEALEVSYEAISRCENQHI